MLTSCCVSCKVKSYLPSQRLAMTGKACNPTSTDVDLQCTVFGHTEAPKEDAVKLNTMTAVCNSRPAAHMFLPIICQSAPPQV